MRVKWPNPCLLKFGLKWRSEAKLKKWVKILISYCFQKFLDFRNFFVYFWFSFKIQPFKSQQFPSCLAYGFCWSSLWAEFSSSLRSPGNTSRLGIFSNLFKLSQLVKKHAAAAARIHAEFYSRKFFRLKLFEPHLWPFYQQALEVSLKHIHFFSNFKRWNSLSFSKADSALA